MLTRNLTQKFDRKRQGQPEVPLEQASIPLVKSRTLVPSWVDQRDLFYESLFELKRSKSEDVSHLVQKCESCIKSILANTYKGDERLVVFNVTKKMLSDLKEYSHSIQKERRDRLEELKDEEREHSSLQGAVFEEELEIIQQRNEEIRKLEKDVVQLATLFRELNTLVVDQGELVDRIDHHVEVALTHTVGANTELKVAEEYQKASRKRWCCVIMILVFILGCLVTIFAVKKA